MANLDDILDLPLDEYVRRLKGSTNAELREMLYDHWCQDVMDYEHKELLDLIMEIWKEGTRSITDYSRRELVTELTEIHPEFDGHDTVELEDE